MRKLVFICIFLQFQYINIQAQESDFKDRLNIKIAYCSYPWMGDISYDFINEGAKSFTPAGIAEVNYSLLNYLETGAYLGFSMYERADFGDSTDVNIIISRELKPMVIYGLSINLQLLPLIIKQDEIMSKIYISSKLGGIYFTDKNKNYLTRERTQIEYGIYGGVAIQPFNHLGGYCEYGYSNYVKWKYGLIWQF